MTISQSVEKEKVEKSEFDASDVWFYFDIGEVWVEELFNGKAERVRG
jgi:hypothetical protein